MTAATTLFDPVARRALVYTNRFNLLEILSGRLIPPRGGYDDERYFTDLTEACPGRIPFLASPSADVLDLLASAGGTSFPVIVELDPEQLEQTDVPALSSEGASTSSPLGAPGSLAWAPAGPIALMKTAVVHFRTAQERDEHKLRGYANVADDVPLHITPELFEAAEDHRIVSWLQSLEPAPESDLRRADRVSGALDLAAQALPADEAAAATLAAVFNGRPSSTVKKRPREFAPWLAVLAAGARRGADLNERLFAAAVEVLAQIDYPQTWRPLDHAAATREAATRHRATQTEKDELARHFDAIEGILRNERDFRPFRPGGLTAAKALLLLLLRPDVTDLLSWPPEETAADPETQITAAALAGVLHGRKRLSVELRPRPIDELLAQQEAAQASLAASVNRAPEGVQAKLRDGVLQLRTRQTKELLLERTLPPAPSGDATFAAAPDADVATPEPAQAAPEPKTPANPTIAAAVEFAVAAHAGQSRKGTTFPYVVHPIRVAEILSRHGFDENVVVAGVLHDTLEDTSTSVGELQERFGERGTQLVLGVSEESKLDARDVAREQRMRETIEHLKVEPDVDVLRITAADKLDNVRALRETIAERGDTATWNLFNAGRDEQARYYRDVAETLVFRHPREPLFQLLEIEVQTLFPSPGERTSTRLFYAQPIVAPEQARLYLADPKLQWRRGRSAFELAHSWVGAEGIPLTVRAALDTDPLFADAELAEGLFEREVALRTPGRPSQTDLLLLLRLKVGHAVAAVEGKAGETFGDVIGTWNTSAGKERRLQGLCDALSLDRSVVDELRYQLLHRTVSAVYEAERYGAAHALLLVHAFAADDEGLADFSRFALALGLPEPEPGRLSQPVALSSVDLRLGWIQDAPA